MSILICAGAVMAALACLIAGDPTEAVAWVVVAYWYCRARHGAGS